ncbi:hypothetical protein [Plantibacter sp. CFBP 8804]|uniref:hypothetical protein n=1 Tax=Plantibacter sp. CFBP 8804 TaxID=2775270 RepID=UPI00177D8879|nr:hypothetical protein [Plantibacter sp. CFBP 8804]MBD8515829.1 hypothetical protein [Plantibacter sp. CFBP 8804]
MNPTLAAVLGTLGFALSLVSLSWNVTQYLLTGQRVRVTLAIESVIPNRSRSVHDAPPWYRSWHRVDVPGLELPHGSVNLIITARNIGRAPVTIERFSVRSGREGRGVRYGDELNVAHRLEAGASFEVSLPLADAEAVLRASGKTRYRGQVLLATGRRRRSRRSYDVRERRG